MVFRNYSTAKGLGFAVAFVIFIIILGITFTPLLHVLERGTSKATFGFPSTSEISSASGVNATFEEQGNPMPTNGSTLSYNSGIVSGEYVYYNSTSNGSFELFEFKMLSNENSSSLYSYYYTMYHNVILRNHYLRGFISMSANLSALGFTYFYFQENTYISAKVSVGFSGSYTFLLAYIGNAKVDINNTAENVIMQM